MMTLSWSIRWIIMASELSFQKNFGHLDFFFFFFFFFFEFSNFKIESVLRLLPIHIVSKVHFLSKNSSWWKHLKKGEFGFQSLKMTIFIDKKCKLFEFSRINWSKIDIFEWILSNFNPKSKFLAWKFKYFSLWRV